MDCIFKTAAHQDASTSRLVEHCWSTDANGSERRSGARSSYLLWCQTLVTMLIFTLSIVAIPDAKAAPGVNSQFNKAWKLFERGNLRRSYQILGRLKKRYPGHQPTQLLIGRIFFRRGKLNVAARHFKKVSPNLLSADDGYEYGVTFFQAGQCDKAKRGFQKVPARSRAFGPANFYLAMCEYRAGRISLAAKALGQARSLPATLKASKRRLDLAVRKKLREERRGVFSHNNPYVVGTRGAFYGAASPSPAAPAHTYAPPVAFEGVKGASKGSAAKVTRSAPEATFSTSATPSLVIGGSRGSSEKHGYANGQTSSNSLVLGVDFNGTYQARPLGHGGQPSVSVSGGASQKTASSDATNYTYVAYESDPTNIREVEEVVPTAKSTTGNLKGRMAASYPVTGSLDVAIGYGYSLALPDLDPAKQSAGHGPDGSVTFGYKNFTFELGGSMTSSLNELSVITSNTTTIEAGIGTTIESLALDAYLKSATNTPYAEGAPELPRAALLAGGSANKTWDAFALTLSVSNASLDGNYAARIGGHSTKIDELNALKVSLSSSYQFAFGGSLTGSVYNETLTEGIYTPTAAEGSATETVVPVPVQSEAQGVAATFSVAPWDWMNVGLTYSGSIAVFSLADPVVQAEYEKTRSSDSHRFSYEVGFSKAF